MAESLNHHDITHAHLAPVHHPRLDTTVNGRSAVRYLRFLRPVRLDRLELPPHSYGRWIPAVPVHPARVIVSVLDPATGRWQTIKTVDLPPDPRIAGAGLSQEDTIERMDAYFARILRDPPITIALDGLETDHLRLECDREHPVWPNHGECNGGTFNVPFGILRTMTAHGQQEGDPADLAVRQPLLQVGRVAADAPQGMAVRSSAEEVRYTGDRLSVGFSLRRPMLTHLGWDEPGATRAEENRLKFAKRGTDDIPAMGGLSGPMLRTLNRDAPSHLWTGQVDVDANVVQYTNLHGHDGLRIDATFTIERDRIRLHLRQRADRDIPVLEAEAWRFALDLYAGISSVAGLPTELPGRSGDVALPAMLATDGVGCLLLQLVAGDPQRVRLQVDSHRGSGSVTAGIVLAPRPSADHCLTIPKGEQEATLELALANLMPDGTREGSELPLGVRRQWGTVFAGFRSEFRGFSNHSASINCHLAQAAPMEVVAHTRRPDVGPDPIELGRFAVGTALLDGGGYGYWRNLYLDSDPCLICAAGRLHQARPDVAWLRKIMPGLLEAVARMARTIESNGLLVCRDLSGNAGSFRWSTNAFDVVGFGHIDGYVNAWAYRAFRNAAAMLEDLGRGDDAARCREHAAGLKAGYAPALLNPDTGWLAGWRSRDEQLHDYAFTMVNGVAIAFGLLDPPAARRALAGLERLREAVGMTPGRFGIPSNFLPIHHDDHLLPRLPGVGQPTFENYTDGALNGWTTAYYLRALSRYDFHDQARRLADDLDAGHADGVASGGMGSGVEFRSWEGLPTGYEGTLNGCFATLYAIAIEKGAITARDPEWWPANG
ncbi:MAG: hypothetical protein WD534_15800 [Phycisphaeraceae bacterium]